MAIGNPQIIFLDAREDRPQEGALLRMAIFTGKDIRDEPLGRLIDHQGFARESPSGGRAQFFDPMFAGFQTVPIDHLDPIPRQPWRPLATHGRNQRGAFAGALAHQCRRGVRLKAIEFVIDGDDGGPHVGFVSPVRRAHRGLHTKHDLAHQVINGGKQARARVWLLRGAPLPQIEAVSAQYPLQRRAHHDRDGTLFHKAFKHLTKHGASFMAKF